MDTVNYQAKVQALLGYLSEHNYSDSCVRRFLRWAGSIPGGEHYLRILHMVPQMKQTHKLFDCLSEEEDARLVSYVVSNGCRLSLKDRANVKLTRVPLRAQRCY
jgi:hypothetical protein